MSAAQYLRAALRAQADHKNPRSFAARMRARRATFIRGLIDALSEQRGACSIVDLGGTASYWAAIGFDYLRLHRAHITLINLRPSPVPPPVADLFTSLRGDATALPFPERHFDLCHSNSVIEHVGAWPRKVAFARETMRVASVHYVQTPNYWFPVEPHYLLPAVHWLPKAARAWLLARYDLGTEPRAATVDEAYRRVEACALLTARELRTLFPLSTVVPERVGPLAKSYMVIGGERMPTGLPL